MIYKYQIKIIGQAILLLLLLSMVLPAKAQLHQEIQSKCNSCENMKDQICCMYWLNKDDVQLAFKIGGVGSELHVVTPLLVNYRQSGMPHIRVMNVGCIGVHVGGEAAYISTASGLPYPDMTFCVQQIEDSLAGN